MIVGCILTEEELYGLTPKNWNTSQGQKGVTTMVKRKHYDQSFKEAIVAEMLDDQSVTQIAHR
jgi:ribosomal protein L23